MTSPGGRPAVFLDRDGTVNVDPGYLSRPEDLELLPGAAAAIARLNRAGYLVVLVTNQSGIARGMFDEQTLAAIHRRLASELARDGARVDRVEYCPHHPEQGAPPYRARCECRKPEPGMLRRATAALGIDTAASWTIGDSARDLRAGAALGVRGVLVLTGKGEEERERLAGIDPVPSVAADLGEAVDLVLGRR